MKKIYKMKIIHYNCNDVKRCENDWREWIKFLKSFKEKQDVTNELFGNSEQL